MPTHSAKAVKVGPFAVCDLDREGVVDRLVDLTLTDATERVVTAYALHVGGLNLRNDVAFVRSMREADLVYADGGSVVWLANRAGAQHVERAATTDIGWEVLRRLTKALGAPPKVAYVGGHPGLAEKAAAVLSDADIAETSVVMHGYHKDWSSHVQRLKDAQPDIILVGMGAPREMLWTQRWASELPNTLVLTCGGWFGFLAGEEKRAPSVIRRSGLEWIGRVTQSPARLGPRYVKGALSTAALAREMRPEITVEAAPALTVDIPNQRTARRSSSPAPEPSTAPNVE